MRKLKSEFKKDEAKTQMMRVFFLILSMKKIKSTMSL